MNSSPLSKDQKIKKLSAVELPKFKKQKYQISVGTTKKILKPAGVIIGSFEMIWLNNYMENRIQGECLPRSFLTNELPIEIIRIYGKDSDKFIERIITDFRQQCGHHLQIQPPDDSDSVSD
jgi:hypothetical protein